MLLRSSKNKRLEVTRFSAPTTSGTVSVIRRNALCNTFSLTVPSSRKICPMCKRQMTLWYTRPPSLGLGLQFKVESLLKAFRQFNTGGAQSAKSTIVSSSLFQLRHPDTHPDLTTNTIVIQWSLKKHIMLPCARVAPKSYF